MTGDENMLVPTPGDAMAHLPGPVLIFNGVHRQRCAWCGAVIDEVRLERVMMLADDRRTELPGWPTDKWVKHENGVAFAFDAPVPGKAPDDSCMVLLPEMDGLS